MKRTLSLSREKIHTGSLILVNNKHRYQEALKTSDPLAVLIPINENFPAVKLQRRAVVLLTSLMNEISGWHGITAVSGWRSFQEQEQIWNDTLREQGLSFTKKYVAAPGCSEHQTGLAVDLGQKQKTIDFIRPYFPYSGICQKFRSKAAEYGFIERYPAEKEAITGISHEPWHFRYVGAPHAQIMVQNNLTLEEYISFLEHFPRSERAYKIQSGNQQILISYQKFIPDSAATTLMIDSRLPCSISGNNTDGFIITEWK